MGSTWASLLASAATPRDIVQRMSHEVTRIVRGEEVRARLDGMRTCAAGGTPEQCNAFIAAETAKRAKVIKNAGVKATEGRPGAAQGSSATVGPAPGSAAGCETWTRRAPSKRRDQ